MKSVNLVYVGDPMCPWCWGFSPVMKEVVENYSREFSVRYVAGGLRVGEKAMKMEGETVEYVRDHWECAHFESGQPFDLEFPDRMSFDYNTEPACRAVVTVRKLAPEKVFAFESLIQERFYQGKIDPTDYPTLEAMARECSIPAGQFRELYHSEDVTNTLAGDFHYAASRPHRILPLLFIDDGQTEHYLARGFTRKEHVLKGIEQYISGRLSKTLNEEANDAAAGCILGEDCCGDL